MGLSIVSRETPPSDVMDRLLAIPAVSRETISQFCVYVEILKKAIDQRKRDNLKKRKNAVFFRDFRI